jgi:hypothetical protein
MHVKPRYSVIAEAEYSYIFFQSVFSVLLFFFFFPLMRFEPSFALSIPPFDSFFLLFLSLALSETLLPYSTMNQK